MSANNSTTRRPGGTGASDREPSTQDKLALRLHLRLATCRNLLMRAARRSIDRWHLTLPQFDVLAELARADARGFTFLELSRLLLVTSGNLTGIVDRLEREQLVRRVPDTADRRAIRIRLTPKGRRLTARMLPAHAGDLQGVLAAMPRDELADLAERLGQLRDYLHRRGAGQRSPADSRTPEFRDQ